MLSKKSNEKKRHHYVPVTYLNRFADARGRIFAYRKDGPVKPLHLRPSEIAFERYYYSQPLPSGDRDNNTLEDLFSKVESDWPNLVSNLAARRNVNDKIEALFDFIGLLRFRVPAARDPAELLLAQIVRRQMQVMIESGEVPPLPGKLTLDDIQIAIDPHQSIHAMASMLQGFARFWEHVGLEVVHNTTTELFATSDNPVIYFDPDVSEDHILPYTVRPPERRVEFLMSISPTLMLRGKTDVPILRKGGQLQHVEMASRSEVDRVNRFVARFGYRFIFANHGGLETLVSNHASFSPTVRFDVISSEIGGYYNLSHMVFGRRPKKPKW